MLKLFDEGRLLLELDFDAAVPQSSRAVSLSGVGPGFSSPPVRCSPLGTLLGAIGVEVEPPRVGLLTDVSATEDAAFSFIVPAGVLTDPQDLPLTLSATLADGSVLPSWLTFNPAAHEFSGIPGNDNVGSLSVKLIATNSAGRQTAGFFGLAVANVNDAPSLPRHREPGGPRGSSVQPHDPGKCLRRRGRGRYAELRADARRWFAAAIVAELRSRTRGVLSGTPFNADVGTLSLRVTATDSHAASASLIFKLAVANANDAPIVATALVDQNGQAGVPFSYTVPLATFSDPDVGDTLSYSATLSDGSALPAWLSFDAVSRTFSGIPPIGFGGAVSVRVIAADGTGATTSDVFALNVMAEVTLDGTTGNDTLIGTAGRDLINGRAGNDQLNGLAGNDVLDGGAGNDTMAGGPGDDLYVVDSSSDIVSEAANEGTDTVQSPVTWTLGINIENLSLTGTSAINGTGNT